MNFEAVLIGCITGFLSAFFGIGGSSIDTPILRTFLNLRPFIALGTPLPLTVLTATIASFTYKREHLVNFRVAVYSIIAGVPGMVLGSYLTAYLSGKFLMLLTAVFLCIVGIDFIIKTFKEKTHTMKKPFSQPPVYYIVFLAIAIGILSGVLANGGGIFFVPAYVICVPYENKRGNCYFTANCYCNGPSWNHHTSQSRAYRSCDKRFYGHWCDPYGIFGS